MFYTVCMYVLVRCIILESEFSEETHESPAPRS